ncbi:MAG: DoxX family protein [Terriglobia bacterium]
MPAALPRTLALVRIAVGLLFILFGQFKVMGSEFVHQMVPGYVEQSVHEGQAVGFYKAFLARVVLPNAELFGYLVAWGELLLGLALVIGLWVRAASLLGALHMLSLTLASWHAPGADAPLWQYFANQLSHLPLLLLFVIFFAGRAGEVWGLDAALRRSPKPK